MYTSDYPSSDHPSQACSQNVFKFWKPRGFQPLSRSFFESGPDGQTGTSGQSRLGYMGGSSFKIQVQIQKTLSYVLSHESYFLPQW